MSTRRVALVTAVVLGLGFVVLVVATTDRGNNTRAYQAQLQCKSLAQTIEAYYLNPQSGNQYPESLQQLLRPPFGNGSFLKNGPQDLIDPWGKPYQLRFIRGPDGTKMPLVHTTTNDGTPVSQYGVGPLSHLQ